MASSLPIPQPKHSINPILTNERKKATFHTKNITHLFDQSDPNQTSKRHHFEKLIYNDPTGIFTNEKNIYLHRSDRHVNAIAKTIRLIQICRSIGIGEQYNGLLTLDKDWSTLTDAMFDTSPLSLHWVMFIPNIIALADDEQKSRWLPLCRDWKMIGCYAQTEVGHGSNVRALETTATFVKDDGDGHWIINSPTLTSWKFWPGTMGRSSNHAMVIARLIDGQGIDRGVHNFLVQTRSFEDHTLMPGVTCGDIGPKIGYNTADNGFAKFDHVKIPRRNMPMRFAFVDQNGKYTKRVVTDVMSKITYITMMQVRAWLVSESSDYLRMGTTIAIRYSAVRKQGFKDEKSGSNEENQILDYKQQQYRLFPLLAASYCFYFSGQKVMGDLKAVEERLMALSKHEEMQGRIDDNNSTDTITKTEVGDMHATSCCLKSFTTGYNCDGLEDCRKSCGGHGFLAASGIPALISYSLALPTVEGDNAMLPTQVVKVLLKLVKDVQTDVGKANRAWANCEARYLICSIHKLLGGQSERCAASAKDDMFNVNLCLQAYQHRAARLLVDVAKQIQITMKKGKTYEEAWNESLIQMGRVSKAHALYILLKNFIHGIEEASKTVLGSDEVIVLKDLALLFGLYWIEKDDGEFIIDGYLSAEQVSWVRSCVAQMLDKIRPNAVALVDANDFSDFRLQSALGRYDGNVYEAILETSKKDPLNETEPGPGYSEHLKRLIHDGVGAFSTTASRL